MPRPTLPTTRTDCTVLADQERGGEIGGIEAEAALVRALGSLVAKRRPNAGRPPSPAAPIFVAMTMSSTRVVESPVAVTISRQRRRLALGDAQTIVRPPSICSLGDRADADADADEGNRRRCPSSPDTRDTHAAAVVEPALDQQPAGADRFRILGDERPLLRERQDGLQH